MNDYFLYCNHITCRVVEFYTGNDCAEKTCPGCGNLGDLETY